MVFAERNVLISGGNFHGEYPAKVNKLSFLTMHPHSHPLTHSLTHTHTHTHSLTHTHTHTHTLAHSHPLTHTHTYALTHTLTHSLTHTLRCWTIWPLVFTSWPTSVRGDKRD